MVGNGIKLICLDLDGTLFDSKHRMSDSSIQALQALEKKGAKIAIVTGRGAYEAKKYAKRISDKAYYIGSNGTVVGAVKGGRQIAAYALSQNHIDGLMAMAVENHLKPIFISKDQLFMNGLFDYLLHIYFYKIRQKESIKPLIFMPAKNKLKKDIEDCNISIFKAMFFIHSKKKARKLEKIIRNHSEFELAITNKRCFEITEKGMNKSRGIEALANYLKIDRRQIMAFGDSENDEEMLKYAGFGIAMGNATGALKSVANYVTETNDNEGVSKVLVDVLDNRFICEN